MDVWTIEADGCPKAGDLDCHLVVDLSIEADGRPEAGDFCCHSGVDFCCHLGVDFWAIEVDGCLGVGGFVYSKVHFVWLSKSVGMWYLPKSSSACSIPLDRRSLKEQAAAGGGHSSSGGIQVGMAVEIVPLCPQRTTRLLSVGGG